MLKALQCYPGSARLPISVLTAFKEFLPTGTHLLHLVECGKCRSMSCQRTLVPQRDSSRGPCDRQSGNVSTRPRHLYLGKSMANKVKSQKSLCHCSLDMERSEFSKVHDFLIICPTWFKLSPSVTFIFVHCLRAPFH